MNTPGPSSADAASCSWKWFSRWRCSAWRATGFRRRAPPDGVQWPRLAQTELRITRILDSALDETLSLPMLEEGVTTSTVGETGIELDTTVELLDELENEDGQILQEMYRIEVKARWFENGEWQERTVETWRYGRMYQP